MSVRNQAIAVMVLLIFCVVLMVIGVGFAIYYGLLVDGTNLSAVVNGVILSSLGLIFTQIIISKTKHISG